MASAITIAGIRAGISRIAARAKALPGLRLKHPAELVYLYLRRQNRATTRPLQRYDRLYRNLLPAIYGRYGDEEYYLKIYGRLPPAAIVNAPRPASTLPPVRTVKSFYSTGETRPNTNQE